MKRSTADLQEWANWRHQQTIDQLHKLKSETVGRQSQECTFSPNIPQRVKAGTTKNTPSKLINRHKKYETSRSEVQPESEPPPPIDSDTEFFGDSGSSRVIAESNNYERDSGDFASDTNGRIRELEDEVQVLATERDDLLREKKFWLTKFRTDNAKLAELMMNVKTVKEKLLQEIDSVEKERNRIRSLQADALESSVLERVLTNSPLAEANRSQLPAHIRGRADEVYKILCTLASKCRSNQTDVFELVLSKVEEAENGFLSREEEALETAIEELRQIASSSPGNVMAAINVSKSYPEPMLSTLIEKRDEAIRREGMGNTHSGEGAGEATEVSQADGQVTSSWHNSDSDLKTVMAQNTTLRASVAQLRKKNAELKTKLQNSSTGPGVSVSCRPRGSSREKKPAPASAMGSSGGSAPPGGDSTEEGEDSDAPPPNRVSHRVSGRRTESRLKFNDLPEFVQQITANMTTTYVREIVHGNPLSEKIPVTVLQETVAEIVTQIKSQISPSVCIACEKNKWSLDDSYDCTLDIEKFVRKTLSLPKVYSDAVSLTMLALTYTHSRVSALEDDCLHPPDDTPSGFGLLRNKSGPEYDYNWQDDFNGSGYPVAPSPREYVASRRNRA